MVLDRFDHDVTAEYLTGPESAQAGVDYVFKHGTFTIPAGKLTATVAVKLVKRQASDARSFVVDLGGVTGLPFGNPFPNVDAYVTLGPQPPAP